MSDCTLVIDLSEISRRRPQPTIPAQAAASAPVQRGGVEKRGVARGRGQISGIRRTRRGGGGGGGGANPQA